jgi:universal stress protein E
MQPFRNILVGIDLTQYDAATLQPSPVASEVVHRALWLAGKMSARLTFLSALNVTNEALPHLTEADRQQVAHTVQQTGDKILGELVQKASAEGIESRHKVTLGRPWLEIIRHVLHDKHDLLLVGTRDRKGLGRMIFGSTAIKVVRRCPCPVWVTKPGVEHDPLKVLIASDLSPVGVQALHLAVQLAQATPARLHLLHIVDFPLDHLWCTGLPDAKAEAYRGEIRKKAEKTLNEQIDKAGARALSPPVEVHLVDDPGGLPDEGILSFLRQRGIDLVVMGTIGRSGIHAVMIGNTAERILPELACSLLAVKPAEFVCPVRL